ncbi:MAG: DUF2059 domain-containing protein [Armatimonadaceae bacterium]
MYRFRHVLTLIICLFALAPVFAQEQSTAAKPNPEKIQAIRQLIDLTGGGKALRQQIDQSIDAQKAMSAESGIPPEFWDKFRRRLKVEVLVEALIPVYDKHYTLDEIQAIIAFYQTPVGKKLVEKSSVIMQESYEVGAAYGQKVGEEIAHEMQAEAGKDKPQKP